MCAHLWIHTASEVIGRLEMKGPLSRERWVGVIDTVAIVRVHHEDQALRVLVVVAPQRTDLVLTTDIPNRERDVLVFDSFHVETCGEQRQRVVEG